MERINRKLFTAYKITEYVGTSRLAELADEVLYMCSIT